MLRLSKTKQNKKAEKEEKGNTEHIGQREIK